MRTAITPSIAGVRRTYSPEKFARLGALKDAYDPHNMVFHLNQKVQVG